MRIWFRNLSKFHFHKNEIKEGVIHKRFSVWLIVVKTSLLIFISEIQKLDFNLIHSFVIKFYFVYLFRKSIEQNKINILYIYTN